MSVVVTDRQARFTAFCTETEPRLRRALVAAYGAELGADATADALAWAWEHFERVERMANAPGYLWRVGQTSVRRAGRQGRWALPAPGDGDGDRLPVEPALAAGLAALSPRQRTAVVLVHGYGYPLAEAAAAMGCRVGTLRNHLDRGLTALRTRLGVTDDDR
ncbi:MAG TPA: sigma factor-like helix-turn-helix DNA-binding protein [Iamia sp.]|nr:sigma factor-like helix-turn-helix DNA-binding protein [Iamia sp.]